MKLNVITGDAGLYAHLEKMFGIKHPCGDCMECCVAVGVEELGKPYACGCEHMRTKGGCAIYGQHPESCKGFACCWALGLYGDGNPALRPDKCGFMLTVDALLTYEGDTGIALDVYKLRELTLAEGVQLVHLIRGVLHTLPIFQCVRMYPPNADVGCQYAIADKYLAFTKSAGVAGNQWTYSNGNKSILTWVKAEAVKPADLH